MSRDISAIEAEYEPEQEDIGPESDSMCTTCVHGSLACM